MDRLPTELVEHILDGCDHSSLKNVRLASRYFRELSTPRVFEHLYAGFLEYSLTKLVALARSPLAKYVHKVTFFTDVLPDFDRCEWEATINRWRQQVHGSSCLPRLSPPSHLYTLETAWKFYQQLVRSQEDWSIERQGLLLKESLAMFANLEDVVITCATLFQSRGATNSWPVWKKLVPRMLVGPDDWLTARHVSNPRRSRIEGRAMDSVFEGLGWRSRFPAIKRLTTLEVDQGTLHPDKDTGVSDDSPSRTEPHVLDRWRLERQCFHHLTKFRFNISAAPPLSRQGMPMVPRASACFLKCATQLRKLEFTCNPARLLYLYHWPVTQVFANRFPDLDQLTLSIDLIEDGPEAFLDFLRAHPTITSLELRDMLIAGMQTVVREIPKILKLRHVYMECMWTDVGDSDDKETCRCILMRGTDYDGCYERGMKAYLLGQSEKMPHLGGEGLTRG